LNLSFGEIPIDLFNIVENKALTIPFMGILINSSISIPKSSRSQRKMIETITHPTQLSKGNGNSPTPCLPQWVFKMIEATRLDVGNISLG
jgi:hypothetical protein